VGEWGRHRRRERARGHLAAPAAENLPSGQAPHDVAAAAGPYWPTAQLTHADAPVEAAYLPSAHAPQAVAPAAPANRPAWQPRQPDALAQSAASAAPSGELWPAAFDVRFCSPFIFFGRKQKCPRGGPFEYYM